MLGHSGHIGIFTIWQISWGTTVGSFLLKKQPVSPSGYILLGQDHLLCQWTCTTLLAVLCHSEWHVECLPFSYSSTSFFSPFSFSKVSALETVSVGAESRPLWFPFLDGRITTDATPNHWVFYFQCFPYPVVESGPVLYARFILPCRNSRLLHWCCIKWPFSYLVRWLTYILMIVLHKLIYVIKVVQHLFFFPD